MTKRREQGNYNVADRYIAVANVGPTEMHKLYFTATETFDKIWRTAHPGATHLVLRSGPWWLVTSMTPAKMNDRGVVCMGAYKLFTTEEAAIMYAIMMASQGKEIMNLMTKPGQFVKCLRGYKWIYS